VANIAGLWSKLLDYWTTIKTAGIVTAITAYSAGSVPLAPAKFGGQSLPPGSCLRLYLLEFYGIERWHGSRGCDCAAAKVLPL
jgi:hypothetical protein